MPTILHDLFFSVIIRFPVSHNGRDVIVKFYHSAVFPETRISPEVLKKAKNLDHVLDCRKQLHYLKLYLDICPDAAE